MSSASSKYIIFCLIAFSLVVSFYTFYHNFWSVEPIKIGVMTSLSGDMASRESVLVSAAELAVDEINENGGLLGRQVELVIKDGASNPKTFAKVAEDLILADGVEAVFGCWTSSCRKSVLPVFEKHEHLLYYPAQYEGLESSENIIYLGSVPNQQMMPALEWVFSKLGKKIYLLGSDYVYPRAANQVIKDQVKKLRGEVVGEAYTPLGEDNYSSIVDEIKRLKPDAIFNTINGESNRHFFKALRSSGISSTDIPTFSFSLSENEVNQFQNIDMSGEFVVLSYLQGLNNAKNRNFIQRYQQKFGKDSSIGEIMESVYLSVHLWSKAVIDANSSYVDDVRKYASDRSIQGPSGMLYIEERTRHSWKYIHIAKIEREQLKSVWRSKVPVSPMPYPDSRTHEQWQHYLDELQKSWGGHWHAQMAENVSISD